jgi:hypothetical protein
MIDLDKKLKDLEFRSITGQAIAMELTNTEILTKAIRKAIAGGWDNHEELDGFIMPENLWPSEADVSRELWEAGKIKHLVLELRDGDYVNVEAIIFNHDFAKALWGIDHHMKRQRRTRYDPEGTLRCISCGVSPFGDYESCWQIHLQQMVIAVDLIKYLGEHLDA